jgi:hypothetical protein
MTSIQQSARRPLPEFEIDSTASSLGVFSSNVNDARCVSASFADDLVQEDVHRALGAYRCASLAAQKGSAVLVEQNHAADVRVFTVDGRTAVVRDAGWSEHGIEGCRNGSRAPQHLLTAVSIRDINIPDTRAAAPRSQNPSFGQRLCGRRHACWRSSMSSRSSFDAAGSRRDCTGHQ